MKKITPDVDLKSLIGKYIERQGDGAMTLKVGSISISVSKTIYVHPGGPDTFGWTFITSGGAMCGDWYEIEYPKRK